MARAGWCGACGNYVFLRADGGCGNGHGPEYVSNGYEVADAPAAAPAQPPAYQAPPAAAPAYQPEPVPSPAYPQPAYAAPAAAPPRKKRTGLVITLVIVAILLLCGCATGVAVFSGALGDPLAALASPERQKVQAAGDFFEAFLTANPVMLRRTMPSEAANAADPTFWLTKLAENGATGSVLSRAWEGDTLTMRARNKEDGKVQTLVLKAGERDTVTATTKEDGSSDVVDAGVMKLVKELDGWKVFSLGDGTNDLIRFDAETIRQMQEENK
jgi:hypothetical protein